MDRRYYGLKALLLALAIGVTALPALVGLPHTPNPPARVHYSAAVTMQAALADAARNVSRRMADFVTRVECIVW